VPQTPGRTALGFDTFLVARGEADIHASRSLQRFGLFACIRKQRLHKNQSPGDEAWRIPNFGTQKQRLPSFRSAAV